jgi:hypothetical protein
MKNIKTIYWIITLVFTVLTAVFTVLAESNNRGNILLSGVALMTSSIALGLSDKKKTLFKGDVKVWSALLETKIADENSSYRVSMNLINNSNEPIYDVVYRLRLPSRISQRINEKNNSAREYRHGNSKIIVDNSYGFLGIKGDDGFIPIDVKIQLNRWLQGNIYITVSGSNISPVTFSITSSQKEELKTATKEKPLFAKKIK